AGVPGPARGGPATAPRRLTAPRPVAVSLAVALTGALSRALVGAFVPAEPIGAADA
ncbi:hypothetical protein GA0115261_112972, partial [Streptomyces sp. OspMP-M43]